MMITSVLVAALFQVAAQSKAPAPLAAALVIDGQLVLADVPTRTLRPIPLGDLVPEEADLSFDKRAIVVNARPKGSKRLRLYLVDVATGAIKQLPISFAGDHRFPRFTDDGRAVLFTATDRDDRDGPTNRSKIEKIDLQSGRVEDIPTNPDRCEFEPVPLKNGRIGHLSTSCYVSFQVQTTEPAPGKSATISSVTDTRTELTSSTDRKKLVYTRRDRDGLGFYLVRGNQPPQRLTSVRITSQHVQPRFICPQQVAFVNAGKVWSLDTESAQLTELMDAKVEARATPSGAGASQGGMP
jgi:hypothetical protein